MRHFAVRLLIRPEQLCKPDPCVGKPNARGAEEEEPLDEVDRTGVAAHRLRACSGASFVLPLFLQVASGLSVTRSGLLLPLTAGVLIGSVGSGRLTARVRKESTERP